MNTIKIASGSTRLIAHRGVSGLETENTMAAFIASVNRSYYASECDVHLTKDGVMVISHDGTIARVSNYKDVIANHTYHSLSSKCLNDVNTKEERLDLRVPTLRDVLYLHQRYEKNLVIELKDPWDERELEAFHQLLDDAAMLPHVTVISFLKQDLLDMRELDATLPLSLLTGADASKDLADCYAHNLGLDIHHSGVTASLVKDFHDHGLTVNCWTVNDPVRASELIALGVDFITTNILESD